MSEQNFEFDKFMQDITKREEEKRKKLEEYAREHSNTPQRKYNELYRELPQNRVRYYDESANEEK
tara:strand:- start:210 stop:404 length:195 start_codon:yes stop_codon:yes gene_type:complete